MTRCLGLLLLPLLAFGQQEGRRRAGDEPPSPLKGDIRTIADPMPLPSFKYLCEHADMIVEGVVETEATRRLPGRDVRIETDFWIAVDRVIKGPSDTRKLVTSEMGGAFGELRLIMNYSLLERGQRYILFLYADHYPDRPQIPGLARYRDDSFYGRYLIEDGKVSVRLNAPVSALRQYEGMTTDQFFAEIRAQLQ